MRTATRIACFAPREKSIGHRIFWKVMSAGIAMQLPGARSRAHATGAPTIRR